MTDHIPSPTTPAYRDPNHPVAARVADLLAAMTLEEKVGQMCHPTKAIPRLGIPAYSFANEALHGVARNGRATVFPQAIGLAATWDPALIRRIGSAIGDEARAKYHAALRRQGETTGYQGLTFWTPNINIFRDPRWGRGQETWGEDPFLTGEMAAAFVVGLQGDDLRDLKAAACAKHFAVHSDPEALNAQDVAVANAAKCDVTIACMGLLPSLVRRGRGRHLLGRRRRPTRSGAARGAASLHQRTCAQRHQDRPGVDRRRPHRLG